MSRVISITLVSLLAVSSVSSLMTQEEARALAKQLSSFDAEVIDKLRIDPDEDRLRGLTDIFGDTMDVAENSAANLQALSIASSIKSVKSVFKRYQSYNAKFRNLAKELRSVDAEMTKVHEHLYYGGEPKLFDLLAYNKDPETNCVTYGSSIRLILQLYKSLINTEIQITAIELYSRELQMKLGTPDSVTESMIWSHFDSRTDNLRRVTLHALDIANQERKKCKA